MTIDIEKLADECYVDDYYNESPKSLTLFAEAYAAKVLEDKEREIAELKAELSEQLEIKKQMQSGVVQVVDAIAEYFGKRNPYIVKLLEQVKELR